MTFYPSTDFGLEVAKGRIAGHSHINKFGNNTDIDTTTDPEDLWSQGGLWVPPTTARIHDIVSADAADDGAPVGTGARTIRVIGLDSSFNEAQEDIIMNGTSNVATIIAYTRIYRMYLLTAGSGETNAGAITATAQTDATVTASIAAGAGQTLMAVYTVPTAKTAYMTLFYTSINYPAAAAAEIRLYARGPVDTADAPRRLRHITGVFSDGGSVHTYFQPPKVFVQKTDIWLQVTSVTNDNTDISGGFDLYLVDN